MSNTKNTNGQAVAVRKSSLPELAKDLGYAKEMDDIAVILNSNPPAAWVKEMKGIKYLPIERVETLLTQIFQAWSWQVVQYNTVANSICVQGRLTVTYPNGTIRVLDGLGAAPINTKQGASPMDLNNVIHDSVQKALPAAESYALKDAADKLGKLFGADLGRKGDAAFEPKYSTQWTKEGGNQ